VHWLKVHEDPARIGAPRAAGDRQSAAARAGEQISAFLPVVGFEEGRHVFFSTLRGTVKKTELMAYANRRAAGIFADRSRRGRSAGRRALGRQGSGDPAVDQERQAIRFAAKRRPLDGPRRPAACAASRSRTDDEWSRSTSSRPVR